MTEIPDNAKEAVQIYEEMRNNTKLRVTHDKAVRK